MRRRLKRRTVEKVVKKHYVEGFLEGLSGFSEGLGLEYASTSRLYSYNGVRRIAEKGGAKLAQKVLADYEKRKRGELRFGLPITLDPPAEVWALAYAEAGIARR